MSGTLLDEHVTGGGTPRPFPLRLDATDAIAALREALAAAGFTEPAVCARTGAPTIYDFVTVGEGRPHTDPPADALDVLIRLFMDGEPVRRDTVAKLFGRGAQAAYTLGMLRPHPSDASKVIPTVLLYPTCGLFVASDLEHDPASPPGTPYALPRDAVYPAVARSTQMFLSLIPVTPCDRFLDLCTGTGIAALRAANSAKECVATDIAERSVSFGRFNARLNGLENVRVLRGDMYEPVGDETFDRITAHPPYMPALRQRLIYRDGGEDGEQVTQRVIEGLPRHLRPGGRFDCTCILTDRVDAPVEKRVRAMLGESNEEFDLLVIATQVTTPTEAYTRLVRNGRLTFAEGAAYVRRFEELGAEALVGCALVITRHRLPRPPVTVRRARSHATDTAAIDWMLRWMEASTDPVLPARLLDARPRLSPRTRLDVSCTASADGWRLGTHTLRVDAPFAMAVEVNAETAAFLARCDGSRTVREHTAELKASGVLPDEAQPEAFAAIVRSLAVGGFLSVAPDQPPINTVG